MRRNKVQHENKITFISLRIRQDTLNSSEYGSELLFKYVFNHRTLQHSVTREPRKLWDYYSGDMVTAMPLSHMES